MILEATEGELSMPKNINGSTVEFNLMWQKDVDNNDARSIYTDNVPMTVRYIPANGATPASIESAENAEQNTLPSTKQLLDKEYKGKVLDLKSTANGNTYSFTGSIVTGNGNEDTIFPSGTPMEFVPQIERLHNHTNNLHGNVESVTYGMAATQVGATTEYDFTLSGDIKVAYSGMIHDIAATRNPVNYACTGGHIREQGDAADYATIFPDGTTPAGLEGFVTAVADPIKSVKYKVGVKDAAIGGHFNFAIDTWIETEYSGSEHDVPATLAGGVYTLTSDGNKTIVASANKVAKGSVITSVVDPAIFADELTTFNTHKTGSDAQILYTLTVAASATAGNYKFTLKAYVTNHTVGTDTMLEATRADLAVYVTSNQITVRETNVENQKDTIFNHDAYSPFGDDMTISESNMDTTANTSNITYKMKVYDSLAPGNFKFQLIGIVNNVYNERTIRLNTSNHAGNTYTLPNNVVKTDTKSDIGDIFTGNIPQDFQDDIDAIASYQIGTSTPVKYTMRINASEHPDNNKFQLIGWIPGGDGRFEVGIDKSRTALLPTLVSGETKNKFATEYKYFYTLGLGHVNDKTAGHTGGETVRFARGKCAVRL